MNIPWYYYIYVCTCIMCVCVYVYISFFFVHIVYIRFSKSVSWWDSLGSSQDQKGNVYISLLACYILEPT